MDVYQSGNDITLSIPYVTKEGTRLYPNSVTYRVLSEDNAEIIAETVLTIDQDDDVAAIIVLAADNALGAGVSRAMRVIELTVTTDTAVFVIDSRYLIEDGDGLVVNTSSFVTYNEAFIVAIDIPKMESWDLAPEQERISALLDAYLSINSLRFVVAGFSFTPFALSELTADNWLEMPAAFISALKRAQLAEANTTLGGDWIEDKRRDGLMSETIGESSNMFRPGKPLQLLVGSQARRYLTGYISLAKRIGRA